MNYTSPYFWLLFALVYVLYGRLGQRGQNRLLLVASYVFYGLWDFRFVELILVSTVIDYIGGLGVAGIRLPARRLLGVLGLVVLGSLLLCSRVSYGNLFRSVAAGDMSGVAAALPGTPGDFAVPLLTIAACALYAAVLPWLYGLKETRRRKTFLAISMAANLGILGFFKYFDFFAQGFRSLLALAGIQGVPDVVLGVILPAGISFYTFQAMSYTIDVYRGDAEATEDLGSFALFICFFPHLVAGPIMRAHTLLPQVLGLRPSRRDAMEEGLYLVMIGLFKKLVIADNVATIANAVFFRFRDGRSYGMTGADVMVGVYAFAFQIWADFSGYSAIARGVSKWLGYELVVNFDQPYLATSPSDFWRRWHISLSTWLRDYLYIPLGGNRRGTAATYRNLMLTMLLGGLWHGAAWTFVAWGLYHGLILCAFRALGVSDRFPPSLAGRMRYLSRVVLMFHLTCLGWLLFRSDDFGVVVAMVTRIVTEPRLSAFAVSAMASLAYFVGPWLFVERATGAEFGLPRFLARSTFWKSLVLTYLVISLILFRAGGTHDFIYFQF